MKLSKDIKIKRSGFTLIELLAVMSIMAIMSAVVLSTYFSMTRGTGVRVAVSHLQSKLALARQNAVITGKKTYVIFTNESSYVVCGYEGTATSGSAGTILKDKYGNLGKLSTNLPIYNLSAIPYPERTTVKTIIVADNAIVTFSSAWNPNDKYGWEVDTPISLPLGFKFGSGTPVIPDPVAFNTDGTPVAGATIRIYEEINPSYVISVIVMPTGLIKVQFP